MALGIVPRYGPKRRQFLVLKQKQRLITRVPRSQETAGEVPMYVQVTSPHRPTTSEREVPNVKGFQCVIDCCCFLTGRWATTLWRSTSSTRFALNPEPPKPSPINPQP